MSEPRIVAADGGLEFVQEKGEPNLLTAALRAGVAFPYECHSGGCGSCRYTPVSGDFEVLWAEAPGRSRRDIRKGIQLACQTRALTDLEIEFRPDPQCRPVIEPVQRSATLASVEPVTRDITAYRLVADEGAEFLPGQYSVLSDPGGTRRCYSMSNLANPDGAWEFLIKRVPGGNFTGLLADLKVGDTLSLDGPYGMAYLKADGDRDVVCVAGGSGLSPMVSIARGLDRIDPEGERRLYFYYGGREADDLVTADLLDLSPGRTSTMDFVGVVSEGPGEPRGYVHEAMIEHLGEKLVGAEVFFAGPPPMTEALHRALVLDLGVPVSQVHFDRFF